MDDTHIRIIKITSLLICLGLLFMAPLFIMSVITILVVGTAILFAFGEITIKETEENENEKTH